MKEADAALGLLQPGWKKGLLQIVAWFAAFLVARSAGLIALLMVGAASAVHWALKRWQPALGPRPRLIIAVQAGYALSMCIAFAAPGGFAQVAADIILMATMVLWFWRRQGVAPLWILIAYHVAATGVMWADLTAPTFRLPTALAHTGVRAFAVVVMASYLWERHLAQSQKET